MRLILALFVVVFPALAFAGEVLQYEPAVVQVTGILAKGKHEHPNGTWFNILILKLNEPASIKGDGAKDSINVSEDKITEIQVSSMDNVILKKLGALDGKKVTLSGTLFHSHTAWHVRELVIMATSVK
jgi:hypothetical protein